VGLILVRKDFNYFNFYILLVFMHVFSTCFYHIEFLGEKRENTYNSKRISVTCLKIYFLRKQCYKWQNCEARRLESQISTFLERREVSNIMDNQTRNFRDSQAKRL